MIDSLLKSDFVAKMAETEWVKKNITSRNITLQLQLHSVKGTLTLNFPPAPSDRIWQVKLIFVPIEFVKSVVCNGPIFQ